MKLNKEKYLIYELIITLIFFGYFIFSTLHAINNNKGVLLIYFNVAIGYTVAIVVLILLLLFFTKSTSMENDERDEIIESRAFRNAYFSIIGIINVLIIIGIFIDKILEPFIIFNILFATLFVVHLVHNITQLYYYRRGA